MGVSWVLSIPALEGKSGSQVIEVLKNRLDLLAPQKPTNFSVENEVYISAKGVGAGPTCNVMQNSEYPLSTFALLDSGPRVTADKMLNIMMLKMKGFYNSKSSLKIECKGLRYQVGDFLVKVGSVSPPQTGRILGVLLEIEYMPCIVSAMCFGLMKEFAAGLLGSSLELPSTVMALQEVNTPYDPSDTMAQYMRHFVALRKAHSL